MPNLHVRMTIPTMKHKGLDLHGVLLLDKPAGATSNRVLQQVKHHLGARKAGHTGALDPLATGVLPLCFGEATKFSQYLLESDKAYRVRAQLGIQMDTADADGDIMARAAVPDWSDASLSDILQRQFHGKISQTAPKYSALKHQGVPLYELARAGLATPDKVREVELFRVELVASGSDWFELFVHCSKGTYIRALVEDIAQALGTLGYVSQLRRVQHGPFSLEQTHTLAAVLEQAPTVAQQWLQPMDAGLTSLPKVSLPEDQWARLKHGHDVSVSQALAVGVVRLYYQTHFLGLGQVSASQSIKCLRLLREDLLDSLASN